MIVALASLAAAALLLAAGLAAALVRQQTRHDAYTTTLLEAFRSERAQLLNKVTAPERPMPDGRPTPKITQRRSPAQVRELARVGTVSPPRDPDDGDHDEG